MATLLAVAYDGYLVSAARFNERGGDFGAVQVWSADFGLGAIIGKQDFIESDLHPLFGNAVELFDAQNAVLSDDILLPACFDDSYLGHVCATIPKIGKKDKGFDTIPQQVDDAPTATNERRLICRQIYPVDQKRRRMTGCRSAAASLQSSVRCSPSSQGSPSS